ncbi:MAG: hypothetical protein FJ109_08865 [Deltaproteobacteria bacterium]|nr:hypothetical protein [Deltaproteobacteria bacterium]
MKSIGARLLLVVSVLLPGRGLALGMECTSDAECGDGDVCVSNMCLSNEYLCTGDADCDEMDTCEQECILYDFEKDKCAKKAGTCQYNPDHLEITAECESFCTRLAPCYDKPSTIHVSACPTEGEGECEESTEQFYKDMVLDCKMDCTQILAEGNTMSQTFSELISCSLKGSLNTCNDVFDACEQEAMACFGPGALSPKGFMNTRGAGDTALAGADGSGCAAGRAPRTPTAVLLLLALLVVLWTLRVVPPAVLKLEGVWIPGWH